MQMVAAHCCCFFFCRCLTRYLARSIVAEWCYVYISCYVYMSPGWQFSKLTDMSPGWQFSKLTDVSPGWQFSKLTGYVPRLAVQ